MQKLGKEQGLSIIELMISVSITLVVVAGVMLFLQDFQRSFTIEQEATNMEQNLRMALDALTREIREAGNNPNGIPMTAITLDPNRDGVKNDLRIRKDVNPPNNLTGLTDPYEDMTIVFDSAKRVITMKDNVTGSSTDAIVDENITNVVFTLIRPDGAITTNSNEAAALKIQIDGQTKVPDKRNNKYVTATLTSEVALRAL